MCYCENPDEAILHDIEDDAVPIDALTSDCCWERICEVRGRNRKRVSARRWAEICGTRGDAFAGRRTDD